MKRFVCATVLAASIAAFGDPNEITPEEVTNIVSIGEVAYDSFGKALAEASDGDTLTLLQDVTLTQGLVFDSSTALSLTLDLGGHALSYPTGTSGDYLITVDPENRLVITNGTLTTTGRGAFVHGELDLLADTSFMSDCRTLYIEGINGNTNMPA